MNRRLQSLFAALCLLAAARSAEFEVLKPNGGWCWFQDERAIVVGDQLIFGSVAAADTAGSERGDIEVTSVNFRDRSKRSFKLHPKLQSDDHNVPAFLALPDGRILATYQTHGGKMPGSDLMRWRKTIRPGDISEWTEERTLPVGAAVSYSNPFRLEAEGGRIYLFHRGVGFNPNYLVSDDAGESFRYGGRLLSWPRPVGKAGFTGADGGRPYLKYAQAGDDTIHVITTEDHPRAFDNSIYHGFIRAGKWHATDARVLGELSATRETALKPTDLTPVFRGDQDHVAWMCDLHIGADGHPRVLFSVQRGGAAHRGKGRAEGDGQDHRYYYARWTGKEWKADEIARAGRRLYPGEDDYTGLGAIDPQNVNSVVISTDAHPVTGEPLVSSADGKRHWEIFRGESRDDGAVWNWTAVTKNSAADNLRPIIPIAPKGRASSALLWLRGTFRTYTDYDLDVVGQAPANR